MWNSPFIAKCSSLDFILLDKYIYGQSKGLEWHRLSTNSLTISWYCNSTVILCKDIINLLYFGIYWVDDVQMNWSCSRSSMHFPETLYIFHYIVRSIPFTTQLFCVIYVHMTMWHWRVYFTVSKSGQPQPIQTNSVSRKMIGGNAHENWTLLRLSFIIGAKRPLNDLDLNMLMGWYCLMGQLVEILFRFHRLL